MRKSFMVFFIIFLFCLPCWSMIDSYFFKLKAKIVEIAPIETQTAVGSSVIYSMKVEIINILPNNNASAADISRAKSRFKNTIDIQTVQGKNSFDLNQLKAGDVITGDFEQMEVEMHPAGGYRITNSLMVEKKVGPGFFLFDLILAPFIFLKNLIFGR